MYSTKYKVTSKADLGILSIHTGGAKNKGDPYHKPRSNSKVDDRFRGKQFELPKKNSAFSVFPFTVKGKSDPYNEKISYLKMERRNGFGSTDPAKRDEFSHTVAIKKHKEAIKNELKASKFHLANKEKQQAAKKLAERLEKQDLAKREKLSEETSVFEYDQIFDVTPDEIGQPKKGKSLNLGIFRTTTSDYGYDCDKHLKKFCKNARIRATDEFFNNSHLHVYEAN
eukprot:maker-scaffold_10-snap-gene-7.0-mRNA-1 protein AED:0.02 eAED:0.02 QI:0/0/0/1/1/1/2/0/225